MKLFAAEMEAHLVRVICECLDEERDMKATLRHLKDLADRPGTPDEGKTARAHFERLSAKHGIGVDSTPTQQPKALVAKPRKSSGPSPKMQPYDGPFPRKKHVHKCKGCAAASGSRGVYCYKGQCKQAHTTDSCSWCRH